MNAHRHSHADRGFTLVEVVLVVTLLGIITLVVGNAMFLGIKATADNFTRLDQSNSALAITRYLTGDIQQAEGTVTINDTTTATCGGVAPLRMNSRNAAGDSVANVVTTWSLSSGNLVRRTCVDGGTPTSFVVTKNIAKFEPTACGSSCSTIAVKVTTQGGLRVDAAPFTLTVQRRKP